MERPYWAPGRLLIDRNQMVRKTVPHCNFCEWVGNKCKSNEEANSELWLHVEEEHETEAESQDISG